ncbi:MAG: hypothetical protein Q8934_23035 [Bacillota bacterium]|nr:hypothetical protein [Bacillota bacterium]
MLPSIVNVAEENGLKINPRTLKQKEVLCKCPFCLADANDPKKYYLSLNLKENIYKCWYCKESGGVLQFESSVTGKPFQEVKEKYFGKNRKKYHPAEMLSPKQLALINWDEVKRNHFEEYKKSLQTVIADWKAHVREQRILAFAKLLIGIETMKYSIVIENIKKQAEDVQIPTLVEDVLSMYSCTQWEEWALEGRIIAGVAYKTAKQESKELENALIYVSLAFYQAINDHSQQKQFERVG